ncbi:MAG TPA: UvrD-helicase domain-containing protein [Jatrophihabitans sp.]|uniref:ATP-dependent helicase n=1 Tax=Jatrophihabitans sp. TaxID=1932789 RepID=UPI002EEDAB2A
MTAQSLTAQSPTAQSLRAQSLTAQSLTAQSPKAEIRYQPADVARLLGLFPPTDEQAAVIQAPLEPAVVIAGAGSGKTETMAARVVWLVANELVAPDRILGLTFTRKAAGELQHRIRARLKSLHRVLDRNVESADPTVLTYAAYSGRLVEEHGIVLGCEPGARLLTEAARWQVADAVVRHYDGAFSLEPGVVATVTERLLDLSGQLADHLAEPEQVRRLAARLRAELLALPQKPKTRRALPENVEKLLESFTKRAELLPLVELFSERKRSEGLLDFADQMVLASRLAAIPAVAAVERSRYDVVLLDEYQDSGHAQIQMLAALFGDGRAVTAVGDPLQSIYSWRGASAASIGKFADRFRTSAGAPAPAYSLMTSWRNDRRVLSVANRVAEDLRVAGSLPLTARPEAPEGRVVARYSESVADEATWLAERLRAEWDGRLNWTSGQRTLAVLVRKRSGIALIAQALREARLPVEVVDIGGLLTLPEIADVRAVLQVLADHNAGGSLARLLTGARWRIGPADLVALHQRARVLAKMTGLSIHGPAAEAETVAEAATGSQPAGGSGRPGDDERVEPSLIEALDDLGEASGYSAEGYRRLADCAFMLRRLRRRLDLPLPDLVAEVEQALGLDVEIASRPGAEHAGRANLDRFIDEAARFANDRAAAGVSAFLGYLRAAEEEEYGLKPATLEVLPDRVQVLTVHGAKGLEWDVVAVAGLVTDGFPDAAKNYDWTSTPALLPSPLRGDAGDLPVLDFGGCQHHGDAEARIAEHRDRVKQRHLKEERRLAYVAFTRARKALYACGAAWGAGSKSRPASVFLEELRSSDAVEVDGWWQVAPDEQNPMAGKDLGQSWPADPLAGRRAMVERGAAQVLSALNDAGDPSPLAASQRSPLAKLWERDVELLLAERAAAAELGVIEVTVPQQLSVSDVVALSADPSELARRLRRPLPQQPAKQARRGTAFHQWLEQRWAAESLLDIEDLPGAVDELADAGELEALKAAFERSSWADRTPVAVEVGFEMSFGARVVRGRMDAVFTDPDGRFTVVDWKTGRPPTGADAHAKSVQLALYRLAWAAIAGIADTELDSVAAAFYYVGAGLTVAPANLLDARQLRELVNGAHA